MPSRALVWTLTVLALVLVLVPLAGMLSFGWTGMMGGGMAGMHVAGYVWLILTIVVVAALVALLLGRETKV